MTTDFETDIEFQIEIERALAIVERFQPFVRERFERRSAIDPAFAFASLRYAARILAGTELDTRTRLLVMTGQLTMMRRYERLRETMVAALRSGVPLIEVQEVMLQCAIYGGDSIPDPAIEVLRDEAEKVGRLDELDGKGMPVADRTVRRDREAERARWNAEDAADPRTEGLIEKYGWEGISMALLLRPKHSVGNATFIGSLSEQFAQGFYDFGYADLYGRLILDHRTRLLCMVGNTIAIGEVVQTRHHLRGALRQGATPREVLGVLLQSVIVAGHPNVVPERFKDLVSILDEEGLSL